MGHQIPTASLDEPKPDFRELLKAVLTRNLSLKFQATGYSMSPFIREGDVVTISPKANREPRLGDVVAFSHPHTDRLFIHRVVERHSDHCIIRGDNAFVPDGPIPYENVLGFVTKVERGGRQVFLGQGPERVLIALLDRYNLMIPVVRKLPRLLRPPWKHKS